MINHIKEMFMNDIGDEKQTANDTGIPRESFLKVGTRLYNEGIKSIIDNSNKQTSKFTDKVSKNIISELNKSINSVSFTESVKGSIMQR
jgi:hypothetical protein